MKTCDFISLIFIGFLVSSTMLWVTPRTGAVSLQSFVDSELISKFEPWLWEKVQCLEANGTLRSITVVVGINCTAYGNDVVAAYNFKESIANLLIQDHNVTILSVGTVLSYVTAKIKVSEIKKIATYQFVDGLGDGEAKGSLCLDVSTVTIRSNVVIDRLGYNGSGVRVCILDSGIDPNHMDFSNKDIIWRDFVNEQPNPYDDHPHGHGTRCAGILCGTGEASNGLYRGAAPGVHTLIIGKIADQWGDFSEADAINGLDWAISQEAQIITCSWGFQRRIEDPGWYCDGKCQVCQKTDECVSKRTIVVTVSGNDGLPASQFPGNPRAVTDDGHASLNCPGCAFDVLTIGAINDENTQSIYDDEIAYIPPQWASSRGPTADDRIKPDVMAPGVDIWTTDRGGGYDEFSGTSAAAPHVAGVAALILQAHPYWGPKAVKSAIMATASLNDNLAPLSRNDRGTGIVDALGALTCGLDLSVEAESGETSGYGDYHAVAYLSGRYKIYVQGRPGDAHAVATLKKSFVPDYNLTDPTFFLFPNKG